MPYYNSDLTHYIIKDFFNIHWSFKLTILKNIIDGLADIHGVNIIHRDLHSGNILFSDLKARLCDLGTSKSATESTDNEEEIYGIIPYVAPEVLQGKKYTKASDIYSFGMIMWEVMVGRRPFWDRNHNTELIIEICDGLRPPIITNAPGGYIDLMKKCWHSDPVKRPIADEILKEITEIYHYGHKPIIIKSSDIGPVTTNNPKAIYKSRYLSDMIKSAASTISLRIQSVTSELVKRKFNDNQLDNSIDNRFDNGKNIKRIKIIKDESIDYITTELEFDIDTKSDQSNDEYITNEIDFDI
ncbi:kinase-like domain-containing protein [Rhizophagus irregularis DAOM 181602=DAOM 197198]|nr:kinase-like domain-containing protein [Rhizophagus irregularis DAOM 181602=DAOM 197198]POG71073.1 kinase-like domain-containing protein [Rhizophagus irregularis DAOM 181602=DAOM 197198]|eukprot:XP_025177939.1 kinase-like domain-containing protein [Rhizophagus irregularis DAOM 181602=DAOM 197198]